MVAILRGNVQQGGFVADMVITGGIAGNILTSPINANALPATFDGSSIFALNASNVSTGVLGVARGGTGTTTSTGSGNVVLSNNPVLQGNVTIANGVSIGNFSTQGSLTATANVQGTYILGNGALLSGGLAKYGDGTLDTGGDSASYTTNNLIISSWWGIGFRSQYGNAIRAFIDCRAGSITCQGAVTAASHPVSSDDRLKSSESFIAGAVDTVCKLRPQLYMKKATLEADEDSAILESGLIAQEVYYDAPELRHLVIIDPKVKANIPEHIQSSVDPQTDPDYSSWGEPASLNYTGLIPYLVSCVREQRDAIQALEARLAAAGL